MDDAGRMPGAGLKVPVDPRRWNVLDLLHRYGDDDDLIDANGVFHFERRSRWWWRRLIARIWIESRFEWWTCDMCDRRMWYPILWRHELRHSADEWAEAGYDKPGTLAGSLGPSAP